MYHVVFNSDDNYIKYMVVLIASIIKNTNFQINDTSDILDLEQKNQKGKYIFHVLADFISDDNMHKTIEFFKELNKIYPCEINFHKVDQNIFEKENLFRYYGNYSTYYRLKLASYLPKNLKKCIYLDIDMLVLSDLRELFNFNLQGKILGATCILHPWVKPLKPLNSEEGFFKLKNIYFNSGVMLIDLEKWRKEDIENKCLQFMKKYYITSAPDEVVLNAIFGENIANLPLSWNFLLGFLFNNLIFFDKKNQVKACFSKDYMYYSKKHIKILHYTLGNISKPWFDTKSYYSDLWWHYARQTPFYEEILFKNIKDNVLKNLPYNHIKPCGAVEKIKSHLSYKLGNEILSIKENKIKVLILPFTLFFIFIKHKLSILILNLISNANPNLLKPLNLEEYQDYQQALQIKNYLSYKLGNTLVKHPFSFIFRVNKIYKEWKREFKKRKQ